MVFKSSYKYFIDVTKWLNWWLSKDHNLVMIKKKTTEKKAEACAHIYINKPNTLKKKVLGGGGLNCLPGSPPGP